MDGTDLKYICEAIGNVTEALRDIQQSLVDLNISLNDKNREGTRWKNPQ